MQNGGNKRGCEYEYGQEDMEKLSPIMTLYDAGFNSTEVEQFIRDNNKSDKDMTAERIMMIRKKRNSVLDELHSKQRQLDKLDYLIYELEKEE